MNYTINQTINGYSIIVSPKNIITSLADHIDQQPDFSVAEIRKFHKLDQGSIIVQDLKDYTLEETKISLKLIIDSYECTSSAKHTG